ncbi:hypothetical protein NL676_025334 [Syzygium grande]|nr:hypothetical protein NL676_025334 [Syzygium grande]
MGRFVTAGDARNRIEIRDMWATVIDRLRFVIAVSRWIRQMEISSRPVAWRNSSMDMHGMCRVLNRCPGDDARLERWVWRDRDGLLVFWCIGGFWG